MRNALSVSELNSQIKALLETTFSTIYVTGEISNLTYHNSGHIYFSIKDESSTISCVMFKGNAQYLKFRLEVGIKINIYGALTVYVPRGNYQLLATKIEPFGVGELALAYEQLKKKLQNMGYFEQSRKKQLLKYPKKIGIITSNTGAAIEDMKRVAQNRYPLVEMVLIPTLVQGSGASDDIAKAIKFADSLNFDLIIIGRGGGSVEDLWAFNEENVAIEIYNSKTPIISAVGHESDFVISDFVADVRASTPSNAIEIALPDMNELRQYLDLLSDDFKNKFSFIISKKQKEIEYLTQSFNQNSFESKFNFFERSIDELRIRFYQTFLQILNTKSSYLDYLTQSFLQNEPQKRAKKGYVQTTKNGKIVTLESLKVDDVVNLEESKHIAKAKIIQIDTLN